MSQFGAALSCPQRRLVRALTHSPFLPVQAFKSGPTVKQQDSLVKLAIASTSEYLISFRLSQPDCSPRARHSGQRLQGPCHGAYPTSRMVTCACDLCRVTSTFDASGRLPPAAGLPDRTPSVIRERLEGTGKTGMHLSALPCAPDLP